MKTTTTNYKPLTPVLKVTDVSQVEITPGLVIRKKSSSAGKSNQKQQQQQQQQQASPGTPVLPQLKTKDLHKLLLEKKRQEFMAANENKSTPVKKENVRPADDNCDTPKLPLLSTQKKAKKSSEKKRNLKVIVPMNNDNDSGDDDDDDDEIPLLPTLSKNY